MATKAAAQISPWGEFPYLVTALEELLGSLLETVISATSASEGSIMLLHEGQELLTVNSARGPRQDLVRNARHYLGEGISGWVAKTREPLLLVGSVSDHRFPGTSPQVKDAMCVPLIVEGRGIGVLSLSNKKGGTEFTQADLDRLIEISHPVARVIDTALAQREADAESSAWTRRQLAQEIHDGVLQSLSSLLLHMRLYEDFRKRDPAQAEEELERSRTQAEEALQELRHVVFDLRLPEAGDLRLVEELKQYLTDFQKRSGIKVNFAVSGEQPELPPAVKKNLYRITQEALTNVRRHSGVQEAEVRLEFRPHEFQLRVRDRGKGFSTEQVESRIQKRKFGLLGLQERAYLLGGILQITTAPGQGTTVDVTVPL